VSRTTSTIDLPPAALARLAALGVEARPHNERPRVLRVRAAYRVERLAGGCLLYRLRPEPFDGSASPCPRPSSMNR
jgi:hypothetical protein